MPIEAGHDAAKQFLTIACEQDRRGGVGNREIEVSVWIVPWPRQSSSLPQRNHRVTIRSNGWGDPYSHSIVPGGLLV